MNRFATLTAVALFMLVPGTSALGQTKLTIAGGVNRATMVFSEEGLTVTPESVTRLAFGVSAGIPMSAKWGLHLGAGYSQKGFGINIFDEDVTTEIDFLELTALAGIPFSVSERASVHLLAGPALAFRLSCQLSASYEGEDVSEDCGDDSLRAMDLGLTGGARLEIGLSEKMGVSVGALYNLGLLNMDESEGDESIKNRVLTLQAGVVYSIG